MMPSLEIVTQAVSTTMHQHTSQILLLEVFLLCAVPQLVERIGLSPLD